MQERDVRLLRAPVEHLDAIAPFLQDALVTGGGLRDWNIDDIRAMATANEIDLWVLVADGSIFGGAVSVMRNFPRRTVFDILLLGTEPHREADWLIVLDQLKGIAKAAGATTISGTGRPGWARKLKATETRVFEIEV